MSLVDDGSGRGSSARAEGPPQTRTRALIVAATVRVIIDCLTALAPDFARFGRCLMASPVGEHIPRLGSGIAHPGSDRRHRAPPREQGEGHSLNRGFD